MFLIQGLNFLLEFWNNDTLNTWSNYEPFKLKCIEWSKHQGGHETRCYVNLLNYSFNTSFFNTRLIKEPTIQKYNLLDCPQPPTLVSILGSLRSIRAWGAALGVGPYPRIQLAPRCGVGGHGRSGLGRSKLRAGLVPLHVGHEPWNTQIHRKSKVNTELKLGKHQNPPFIVKSNVYWRTERRLGVMVLQLNKSGIHSISLCKETLQSARRHKRAQKGRRTHLKYLDNDIIFVIFLVYSATVESN